MIAMTNSYLVELNEFVTEFSSRFFLKKVPISLYLNHICIRYLQID